MKVSLSFLNRQSLRSCIAKMSLTQGVQLECVSLRLGKIPSVRCLRNLKKLQVLDLFGTKVVDGDLDFTKSLPGELDTHYWSEK